MLGKRAIALTSVAAWVVAGAAAQNFGLAVSAQMHGSPTIFDAHSQDGPLERMGDYDGDGFDYDAAASADYGALGTYAAGTRANPWGLESNNLLVESLFQDDVHFVGGGG